ncbi:hypothetical protein pb186bvf_017354 [Paramecium bursaria]
MGSAQCCAQQQDEGHLDVPSRFQYDPTKQPKKGALNKKSKDEKKFVKFPTKVRQEDDEKHPNLEDSQLPDLLASPPEEQQSKKSIQKDEAEDEDSKQNLGKSDNTKETKGFFRQQSQLSQAQNKKDLFIKQKSQFLIQKILLQFQKITNFYIISVMDKLKATIDKRDQTILTLEQIIQSQRQQLNVYQEEKNKLEKKLTLLNQQKLNEDLSFDNQIRRLKQEIEKKSYENEQLQNKLQSSDNGLIMLKLRNELEEPHKIELQIKDDEIQQHQDNNKQLLHQLKLQQDRINLIQSTHVNEIQQLKEKFTIQQGEERLEMKQLKEINSLNKKDQEQIRDLLGEKELLLKTLQQKDAQIRDYRQSLEQEKRNKDLTIQLLTAELEQERLQKIKYLQEIENMDDTIKMLRSNPNQNVKDISQIKGNDQEVRDLTTRLNEYMSLFEDEKEQKRKLNIKLQEIINQTKSEKYENDKVYESRIKELQEQIKEERNIKVKQQLKIKDLQADITELKHDTEIYEQNKQRMEEKDKELSMKERKLYERDLILKEREENQANYKTQEETMYENKKIKTKYKLAKQKLLEANQKIVVLLARVKGQQLDQTKQQQNIQQTISRQSGYNNHYKLDDNVDYLNEPNLEAICSQIECHRSSEKTYSFKNKIQKILNINIINYINEYPIFNIPKINYYIFANFMIAYSINMNNISEFVEFKSNKQEDQDLETVPEDKPWIGHWPCDGKIDPEAEVHQGGLFF